jgi:hypothetical protein
VITHNVQCTYTGTPVCERVLFAYRRLRLPIHIYGCCGCGGKCGEAELAGCDLIRTVIMCDPGKRPGRRSEAYPTLSCTRYLPEEPHICIILMSVTYMRVCSTNMSHFHSLIFLLTAQASSIPTHLMPSIIRFVPNNSNDTEFELIIERVFDTTLVHHHV